MRNGERGGRGNKRTQAKILKNSMTEKIRLKTEQINPITEQIKLRE
jgi:hypothetical protein